MIFEMRNMNAIAAILSMAATFSMGQTTSTESSFKYLNCCWIPHNSTTGEVNCTNTTVTPTTANPNPRNTTCRYCLGNITTCKNDILRDRTCVKYQMNEWLYRFNDFVNTTNNLNATKLNITLKICINYNINFTSVSASSMCDTSYEKNITYKFKWKNEWKNTTKQYKYYTDCQCYLHNHTETVSSTTPVSATRTVFATTEPTTTLLVTSSPIATSAVTTKPDTTTVSATRTVFATKEHTATRPVTSPPAATEPPTTIEYSTTPSLEDVARDIESDSSNRYVTDISNPDKKIIVKRFNGTAIGSETKPTYHSATSDNTVGRIVLEKTINDAKVVIIDQAVPIGNREGLVDIYNADTDSTQKFTTLLSDRFLAVSVFSGVDSVPVKEVGFKMDTSAKDMKPFYDKYVNPLGSKPFTRQFVQSLTPSCAFFDNNWNLSEKGCEKGTYQPGKPLSCKCNHTTVFAVLMSANVVVIPPGVKIVSYVAEMTSVLFLLVTVILLWKVRNRVRGDRVKVQICVSGSLLVLHILNLLHDAAIESDTLCEINTVLVHYFLLCSVMWMLMEGLTLLFKTLDNVMRILSGKNAKKFAIARYAVSFGTPFIIVLISASYGFSINDYVAKNPLYENQQLGLKYIYCWIGNTSILIGAVILPIAFILLICIGIVIRMFYIVYKMSQESENYRPTQLRSQSTVIDTYDLEHIKAALKAILVLLPVLGVPWLLGFFTGIENGNPAQHVFMYLNAIVNGFQGVFLFFIYCIIGKEVRKAITKSCIRRKYSLAGSFELFTKQRTTTEQSTSMSSPPTASTHIGDNISADDRSHHSVQSDIYDAKKENKTKA